MTAATSDRLARALPAATTLFMLLSVVVLNLTQRPPTDVALPRRKSEDRKGDGNHIPDVKRPLGETPRGAGEREVTVPVGDGVTLAASVFSSEETTRDGGPRPGVVLLTGATPHHRAVGRSRPRYGFIACRFAAAGFDVLWADDRGAGESGGDYWSCTVDVLAADALALARWLAVDAAGETGRPRPVFLVGASEGAIVAAAAGASPAVAGVALLAPTSVDRLKWVNEYIAHGLTRYAAAVRARVLVYKCLMEARRPPFGLLTIEQRFDLEVRKLVAAAPGLRHFLTPAKIDAVFSNRQWKLSVIGASVDHRDHAADLQNIRCPVWAAFAEHDDACPSGVNYGPFVAAVPPARRTVRFYYGHDHGFRHTRLGPDAAPFDPEVISEQVLGDLTEWLRSPDKAGNTVMVHPAATVPKAERPSDEDGARRLVARVVRPSRRRVNTPSGAGRLEQAAPAKR